MNFFERVLEVHLVKHVERHGQIWGNQHGFVSGRSTHNDVFETLAEGFRIEKYIWTLQKHLTK